MFWMKIVQFAVACMLSGVVLRTVVANLNEREPGGVVVHVTEPDVDLMIDGFFYRIEERVYDPIAQPLRAGMHKLRMTRGDELLYEEDFAIEGGEERVLTAYIPSPAVQRQMKCSTSP